MATRQASLSRKDAALQAAKRPHSGMIVAWTTLIALLVIPGCGDRKPPFQEVSGAVTFQKKPLRKGLIEFVPNMPGGTRAGAIVRDGQYTVRREAGLLPGDYLVTIVPKVPRMADWEEAPASDAQSQNIKISEKYNVNTILTAEVKTDGKQTIDFNLE